MTRQSSYGQLEAARSFCDPSLIHGVFGGSTSASVAALRDFATSREGFNRAADLRTDEKCRTFQIDGP
jgi:hypothetical protein